MSMQTQTRVFVRTAFVLALSALTLAVTLPDIALPWHPFSTLGYSASPKTAAVTWVDRDAAARGLAVGDRIERSSLSNAQVYLLVDVSPLEPAGTRVQLPLTSGRKVTLVSHPYVRTLADNATDVAQMFVFFLIVLIAAALVLMRPAPTTWAFYFYSTSLAFAPAQLTMEYTPVGVRLGILLLRFVVEAAGAAALVSFALRFPQTQPAGAAKIFERILLFGVAPLVAVFAIMGFSANPADSWGVGSLGLYFLATAIVAALVLIARYLGSSSDQRSRLQWIVAAFAVAFIPLAILNAVEAAGVFPSPWLINSSFIFLIVVPLSVAYTVFKHRLFDLRLIVSRALLYAVSTSIVIGLLALVDWGVGKWLAESRFALAAELVMAVAIGVLLTTTHRRLEHFLNSVIFRAQVAALQAVRRFAHETDLIADPQYLLLQTYEALRARLENEYAAIYTAEGSSYALVTPVTEPAPQLFASHDLAVLRLRRWLEPYECEEPGHPLYGALLLPMTARGQLVGFIACGPKRDRTHYLPDEVETLSLLAHRTGSAYALLTLAAATPPLIPAAM